MKRLFLVLLVGLVATAAAAGATSKDPKKVIIPAVQAKAKAINVKLSDLPAASWTPKPSNPASSSPTCSYYNPDQSDLTENGNADSPEFTLPNSSFVASSTSIFKSAAQGRIAYARVVQPKLPLCLAEIFQKGAGGAGKVKIVSVGPRAFPKLADRSNAYRIVADFKSGKTAIRAVLDIVVMNRGKADVVIFFAGIGFVFNDSFEHSVAGKVAARTTIAQ